MLRTIGLVICLIIAVVLGYYGYKEISVDRTNLYQQIPADIISVSMNNRIINSQSKSNNITFINNKTVYDLIANYKYVVNEKEYFGSYNIGEYSSYFIATEEKNNIMNNPNRKKINIFYEKLNPSKSSLTISKNNSIGYFIGSAVFVVIGLVIKFAQIIQTDQQRLENVVIYNRSLFK